jgi:pSer/pThr/pTyr-binding forkhead associated (FHA) protein
VTDTDQNDTSQEVVAEPVSALGADIRNGSVLAGAEDAVSGLVPVPADCAVLVVKRGPNAGSRFRLNQQVTSAGRAPESNVFLDDVTVSRHHAEFRRERGELRVLDVGSLNGTYVNGQPVDATVLTDGDEITMGKFRLVVLRGPAAGLRP